MKYRLIAFLFILVSLEVWAINQEQNKHEEVLEVTIGDGINIMITGNDAMNMYNYLSKNLDLDSRMFLYSDAGMSKSHISTPVIHCQKTDRNVYAPPRQDNDPSLYLCDISISSYGTVDTH